jgi:hypothetical protein
MNNITYYEYNNTKNILEKELILLFKLNNNNKKTKNDINKIIKRYLLCYDMNELNEIEKEDHTSGNTLEKDVETYGKNSLNKYSLSLLSSLQFSFFEEFISNQRSFSGIQSSTR